MPTTAVSQSFPLVQGLGYLAESGFHVALVLLLLLPGLFAEGVELGHEVVDREGLGVFVRIAIDVGEDAGNLGQAEVQALGDKGVEQGERLPFGEFGGIYLGEELLDRLAEGQG